MLKFLFPFQNRASDRVVIDDRKSKSFEEREEQYVEARNRIFQQHSVSDSLLHLLQLLFLLLLFSQMTNIFSQWWKMGTGVDVVY